MSCSYVELEGKGGGEAMKQTNGATGKCILLGTLEDGKERRVRGKREEWDDGMKGGWGKKEGLDEGRKVGWR